MNYEILQTLQLVLFKIIYAFKLYSHLPLVNDQHLNQPGDGTRCHCQCQKIESKNIALRHISNPSNDWANGENDQTLCEHEQPIAGWKSIKTKYVY